MKDLEKEKDRLQQASINRHRRPPGTRQMPLVMVKGDCTAYFQLDVKVLSSSWTHTISYAYAPGQKMSQAGDTESFPSAVVSGHGNPRREFSGFSAEVEHLYMRHTLTCLTLLTRTTFLRSRVRI